jgi:hypothetical protein
MTTHPYETRRRSRDRFVPLTLEQWLVCAAMASVVLWLRELRKWISRLAASLSGRRAARPLSPRC